MGIEEEVNSFVEQTLDKYEKVGMKYRNSYWENYMRETFKDFYLQLKYICEYMKREYILPNKPNQDRSITVYRIGNVFLKFVLQPWFLIKEPMEKPKFVWENYCNELEMSEYVDIVMALSASIFEYYHYMLKNNVVFNCTQMAREFSLGRKIISQIDRNLKILYDTLCERTNRAYGVKTGSLFPPKFKEVRDAAFHLVYSYETIEGEENFKIYLDQNKSEEIKFDKLIELIHEVVAKINTIKIIPYYFASPNSKLPLKGF